MSESTNPPRGPIAWMAGNSVAANLVMLVFVIGGLLFLWTKQIKEEVFPEFDLDLVVVSVAYPGASPDEVEKGVVLAIEEAVRQVDGIKEVRATAAEGQARIFVELLLGTNRNKALADIKSALDRIQSFPQDIEEPVVSLAENRKEVVSLMVYGDYAEKPLRALAEKVRDELLEDPGITVVEMAGERPLEISIEVPREELRRYNLTLDQVAQRVRAASVELPGGGVKTAGGEILVRTTERRDYGDQFGDIAILSRPDGSVVRLADIAKIDDGFRDTDQAAYFNGKRAIMVKVYRVGDETPVSVSARVAHYIDEHRHKLPKGVELATWADQSEIYSQRIDLLMRNAYWGLALVMLILGMFLELGLAFWVTLGIPISFIGSLMVLPPANASINMISLFAFIVTLGMVVDDAIVVGEAIHTRRARGVPWARAAVDGAREVAGPVIFAISTTLIAFAPMLFVPGPAGKFFRLLPIVVIAVLVVSLLESLLVLPAHLAHRSMLLRLLRFVLLFPIWAFSRKAARAVADSVSSTQQRFSRFVEWFAEGIYGRQLRWSVNNRYLTLAIGLAIFITSIGIVAGGRLKFTFLPKVEGDVIVTDIRMPYGTPIENTEQVADRLEQTAREIFEKYGGMEYSRGIFAQVGAHGALEGGAGPPASSIGGSHLGEVAVYLVPVDDRPFTATEFADQWRERVGEIAGVEALKFKSTIGPSAGAPIDIELSHRDIDVLEVAAKEVGQHLSDYPGVYNIDNGFSTGKEQLDFKLKPEAIALGLTEAELARQVRSSFFGAEVLRQQRRRDELLVYVRLPDEQRKSEHDIESLILRTPGGGELPLSEAVEVSRGRSYTEINRRDARRVVNVTAEVDSTTANANEIVQNMEETVLPDILGAHDGLSYALGGEQREQHQTMNALRAGFLFALVGILGLLAVAFRSWIQPLIVMSAIPFGIVGAIWGHVLMGYDLSLMSMFGIVALAGVVVNDSLILIAAINDFRAEGMSPFHAVMAGGRRRFRPIILTSLTTFFGLSPMIVETSVQARFLIPMAISLGFGVLVATGILLMVVPALYFIVEDIKALVLRLLVWLGIEEAVREGPSAAPGE